DSARASRGRGIAPARGRPARSVARDDTTIEFRWRLAGWPLESVCTITRVVSAVRPTARGPVESRPTPIPHHVGGDHGTSLALLGSAPARCSQAVYASLASAADSPSRSLRSLTERQSRVDLRR